MPALRGAGTAGILARAKLQPGKVSHAVSTANVKVALDHLSAAGLDLTVRASARCRPLDGTTSVTTVCKLPAHLHALGPICVQRQC